MCCFMKIFMTWSFKPLITHITFEFGFIKMIRHMAFVRLLFDFFQTNLASDQFILFMNSLNMAGHGTTSCRWKITLFTLERSFLCVDSSMDFQICWQRRLVITRWTLKFFFLYMSLFVLFPFPLGSKHVSTCPTANIFFLLFVDIFGVSFDVFEMYFTDAALHNVYIEQLDSSVYKMEPYTILSYLL